MRRRRRRLAAVLLVVGAAEAMLLVSAGLVMGADQQLHGTAYAIVQSMLIGVGSILPTGFAAGLAAILGLLGADWWMQHLVAPSLSGQTGTDLPALGAVLAFPAYMALRRFTQRQRGTATVTEGPPPHRIYVARTAKALDGSNPALRAPAAIA